MTNDQEYSEYPGLRLARMVILNGDHLEFEREWAGKDPKERPDWPLPSFDAHDWAESFMKIWGNRLGEINKDLMVCWFANALMAGYDRGASESCKQLKGK